MFSSDILYDTLCKYDPDHLMLKITRQEALKGLVDFGRIEAMLEKEDLPNSQSKFLFYFICSKMFLEEFAS